MTLPSPVQHWVVFCKVVDNFGDIGVCWRLSAQLAKRGKQVTLFVDDARPLEWMAPQGCDGVVVLPWPDTQAFFAHEHPVHVVIEAFGCELPQGYHAAMAAWVNPPVWINLEYFSAEPVAVRNHGLPSPVMSGPAKGLTKWFFYPGLVHQSGGMLGPGETETDDGASSFLHAPESDHPLNICVFCYEPASLGLWLKELSRLPHPVRLSLTAGRAVQAVRRALTQMAPLPRLEIHELPFLSQVEFDQLLSGQDFNLVRGEDSLARAIWAGKAFLWHIYPQDDGAHWPKLQAFLSATLAPEVVVQAHLAWNADQPTPLPPLTAQNLTEWRDWVARIKQDLQAQTDLVSRLESFVATHG